MRSAEATIRTLIVFGCPPIAGQCKTRLAQSIGGEQAARLYAAFLRDACLLGRVADRRVLAVTKPHPLFAELAREYDMTVVEQRGEDLGARMRHALTDELGHGPTCLIGSDAPTIPAEYLTQAFSLLADREVVIGPATDGGYWMIGARATAPDVFSNISWSTESVLQTTLTRLKGQRVGLLPFHYDIDSFGDLELLRAHLYLLPESIAPHTRHALRSL